MSDVTLQIVSSDIREKVMTHTNFAYLAVYCCLSDEVRWVHLSVIPEILHQFVRMQDARSHGSHLASAQTKT